MKKKLNKSLSLGSVTVTSLESREAPGGQALPPTSMGGGPCKYSCVNLYGDVGGLEEAPEFMAAVQVASWCATVYGNFSPYATCA